MTSHRPGAKPLSEPKVVSLSTHTESLGRTELKGTFTLLPLRWSLASFVLTNLYHVNGLVQDCSISSALAVEILQSCTKPCIYIHVSLAYKKSPHSIIYSNTDEKLLPLLVTDYEKYLITCVKCEHICTVASMYKNKSYSFTSSCLQNQSPKTASPYLTGYTK